MLKIKLSLYKSGDSLTVAGDRVSQISRQSAHECGQVRPLYPPGSISGTLFCWNLRPPQGQNAAEMIMSKEKFQWHYQESNPRPPNLYRSASTYCPTTCHQFYSSFIKRQMNEAHTAS